MALPDPVDILKANWGYDSFRLLQEDIIRSVLRGKDTFALLPTGGGKSICFQVPGLALGGMTLVISPLIALMQDQVRNLNDRGIPATYVNSALKFREIDRKLQMAMDGQFKFLYLAPERIQTDMFQQRLDRMDIRLLAIDEAHCISQWGYDFRPPYLEIAQLRERLPSVPVIALTASATPKVVEDIIRYLDMREPETFRKSFRRDNLIYRVKETDNVAGSILRFIQQVKGSGIVYARTRKRTVALAKMLENHGIPAAAYHGGLNTSERAKIQAAWIRNETRVIAATNAFGMGIDKPDVRFVLHYNLPSDPESYYQEAGRGGRDGKPALGLAFHSEQDILEVKRWVKEKYPSWRELVRHFEILCNAFGIPNTAPPDQSFPFDLLTVAKSFQVNPMRLYASVKTLNQEGYLLFREQPDDFGWARILVQPREVLTYKRNYPQQAWALDLLLRLLGGEVYSEALPFQIDYWARIADRSPEEVIHTLNQLSLRGIISFRPPTTEPTIRFLHPRKTLKKQEFNWPKYEFLQARANERLTAMLDYIAVPSRKCRALTLENYFGEEGGSPCGQCDHCKAEAAGPTPPQKIAAEIQQLLQGRKTLDYRELLEALQTGTENERKEVIRLLLDQKQLGREGATRLKWTGKPK